MMNKEDTSCAASCSQGLHMHGTSLEEMAASSSSGSDPNSASLLYNLSILKDKVHQVQSLVRISVSPEGSQPTAPRDTNICNMGTLIEEIIITASSMMFTCQQMALQSQKHGVIPKDEFSLSNFDSDRVFLAEQGREEEEEQGMYSSETLDQRYGDYIDQEMSQKAENNEGSQGFSSSPKINSDIIELDASDLLAKYTHYCQICGKGFKRNANLRMHMRAHGDEYKTTAALVNPMKNKNINTGSRNGDDGSGELLMAAPKKYSCPEEGCRWNRKHPKFQPLKSMICVKNHYKRSHCPKLYVCKRCNKKLFSVLSDLRTHEKHCGVVKWQCSCGTTFSRKDKLMGHVALFLGHTPVII